MQFAFLVKSLVAVGECLLKAVRRPLRGLQNRIRLACTQQQLSWSEEDSLESEPPSPEKAVTCVSRIDSNIRKRPLLS